MDIVLTAKRKLKMNLPTHEEEKVIETMLKKIMPAFIAGTAIATTVNVLAKPNIPYERPILKAEYRAYDCDTLKDIPIDAYMDAVSAHAIQRLNDQCARQKAAAVLAKKWEKDPTGGVVLEHHKN